MNKTLLLYLTNGPLSTCKEWDDPEKSNHYSAKNDTWIETHGQTIQILGSSDHYDTNTCMNINNFPPIHQTQ